MSVFATSVLIVVGETDADIDAVYAAIHREADRHGYLLSVQIRETTRRVEA